MNATLYFFSPERWYAAYLADLNQVWTNPEERKNSVNTALIHEFCHSTSCRSKPMQLHQVINRLTQSDSCPTATEYYDFIEAIAMALRPLSLSKLIAKRYLPKSGQREHRDLAKRIMDLVMQLSKKANSTILPHIAKRQMLFVVTTFLSRIVPLVPEQCPKVLDFIESLSFPGRWQDSHEIFEYLLGEISKLIRSKGAESLGFTIARPRDPHMMISEMFQIFDCAISCAPFNAVERSNLLRSVFPILLQLITLDNAGIVPLYWLRRRRNRVYFVTQLWHETYEMLNATEKSLRLVFEPRGINPPSCGARLVYLEVYRAVKDFVTRAGILCPQILFANMLSVLPQLLKQYLDFRSGAHTDCPYCKHCLYDYKTIKIAHRFLSVPGHFVKECIDAANHYKMWLLNECPKEAKQRLEIDLPLVPARLKPEKMYQTKKLTPWIETLLPRRLT